MYVHTRQGGGEEGERGTGKREERKKERKKNKTITSKAGWDGLWASSFSRGADWTKPDDATRLTFFSSWLPQGAGLADVYVWCVCVCASIDLHLLLLSVYSSSPFRSRNHISRHRM